MANKNKLFKKTSPKFWSFIAIFAVIGLAAGVLSFAAPGGKGGGNTTNATTAYFVQNSHDVIGTNTSDESAVIVLGGAVGPTVAVTRLNPGALVQFGGKGGSVDNPLDNKLVQTCYIFQATTGDSVVNIASADLSATSDITVKKVPAGSGSYWQTNCVSPSKKGTRTTDYNIKLVSGPAVLFYEAQSTYEAGY